MISPPIGFRAYNKVSFGSNPSPDNDDETAISFFKTGLPDKLTTENVRQMFSNGMEQLFFITKNRHEPPLEFRRSWKGESRRYSIQDMEGNVLSSNSFKDNEGDHPITYYNNLHMALGTRTMERNNIAQKEFEFLKGIGEQISQLQF